MDEQLRYAADRAEIEPFWGRYQHEKLSSSYPFKVIVADYDDFPFPPGTKGSSKPGGQASLRFCLDAIEAAKSGFIDALVTAPISKTSWKMAGAMAGHTELLAERCKSPRKVMMFVAGPLKMALATIHEALFEVTRIHLKSEQLFEPIDLLNTALKEYFGIENPYIGVAGLNPHAGEEGQFGDEEQRIISPAILLAQEARD